MYNKPAKIEQGIDNTIMVMVKNQDQKGINMTNYSIQAAIQDPVNRVTVNKYPITFTDITRGIGEFILDQDSIAALEQRIYKLTFSGSLDGQTFPVYVDDTYSVLLDLIVNEGVSDVKAIKLYIYPNSTEVQVVDISIFTTRNRVVYTRPITAYQGIDNPIQVAVKTQDQRPRNLTGYLMEAQIQDSVNFLTVATYPVSFSTPGADITKGRGSFILDKVTIDDLEQRFYQLTFKIIDQVTNQTFPVYIDDNYGVPVDLEILPAYWSDIKPAPDIDQSVVDGGAI